MKASRCDRCGEFFSDNNYNVTAFTNPDGHPRAIYLGAIGPDIDLCDTCRVELKEWWNAKGAPTDVQPDVNEEN